MNYVPDVYKQLQTEIVQLRERIHELEEENKQIKNLRNTNRQLRENLEDLRVSEAVLKEEIKRLNQIIKKQNLQAQQMQEDFAKIKVKGDLGNDWGKKYPQRPQQNQDFKAQNQQVRNEKAHEIEFFDFQAKNQKPNNIFGIYQDYRQQAIYQIPKVQRANRKQVTDDRKVFQKLNEPKLIELLHEVDVFSNLQWIYLNNNKITDQGLKEIVSSWKKLKNVSELYLSENQITDDGLRVLAVGGDCFPKLQNVGLNKNQITDEGFKAFVVNGGKFKILQTIGFQSNQITNQGLDILVYQPKNFQKLKRIYLTGNKLTFQRFQEVKSQLRNLFEIVN